MPKQVIKEGTLLWGGVDLSPYANQVTMQFTKEDKDCTTIASIGWREYMAGNAKADVSGQGFWNVNDADATLFEGAQSLIGSSLTNPAAAGDIFYFVRGPRTTYSPGFQVGEIASLSVAMVGDARVCRGPLLEFTTVNATGDGEELEAGAVLSTQKLYAGLFVTAVTGSPQLDIVLESDDNSGFTTAASRITFDQITEPGWQLREVSGAIPDTFWRTARTFGGTGSATYYLILAIH